MAEKTRFTKAILRSILPPASGHIRVRDTEVPGLVLSVTSKGARVFYLYRRIKGRVTDVRIGPLDEVTIEQARKIAGQLNSKIAAGDDPAEQKRRDRAQLTLLEAFDRFEAKPGLAERTRRDDKWLLDHYLSDWKPRRLATITRDAIIKRHGSIGKDHGKVGANRALMLLRRVYNHAIAEGFRGENPAAGIKKFEEKSRTRYLRPDEIGRFLRAVAEDPDELARDFFPLALYTGARRRNVQGMRWADIDLVAGIWTIPQTKNGESLHVPLVPEAMEILERRRTTATDSPYVFPSTGRTGHIQDPRKAWERILDKAKLEDVHIHDLRRSMGSWQAAAGTSLLVIGKALGHRDTRSTEVYARLDLAPVRAAMMAAVRAMSTAPVVPAPGQGREQEDNDATTEA